MFASSAYPPAPARGATSDPPTAGIPSSEKRLEAMLAESPVAISEIVLERYSPWSCYAGIWYRIHIACCPHCDRAHKIVVTGATRPRKDRLAKALAGNWASDCPYY